MFETETFSSVYMQSCVLFTHFSDGASQMSSLIMVTVKQTRLSPVSNGRFKFSLMKSSGATVVRKYICQVSIAQSFQKGNTNNTEDKRGVDLGHR